MFLVQGVLLYISWNGMPRPAP